MYKNASSVESSTPSRFAFSLAGIQMPPPDIADRLDVECAIGTLIEVDADGVLTGRIEHPMCYGPGKLERLGTVTGWSGDNGVVSFAYADSMSDLPLLESVGSPVVVTPDRHLRRVADERDWPVLDV